jgi:hypothetical protein
MLDSSFATALVSGMPSLRLFQLHRDGSMSHFGSLEKLTWRKDASTSARLGVSTDVWLHWPAYRKLWRLQPPEHRSKATGLAWSM